MLPSEGFAKHGGEEGVSRGEFGPVRKTLWVSQAGKKGAFDGGAWDRFFTVAAGLIGRPKGKRVGGVLEVDDEVTALTTPNLFGPPHLEKIAGSGGFDVGEVDARLQVMNEFSRAWAIGVPAPKELVAVRDIEVGVAGEGGGRERERFFRTQLLDDA